MMVSFEESCAMINGEKDVIENAKYVTKFDNKNGGVGYFLDEYLDNKKVQN